MIEARSPHLRTFLDCAGCGGKKEAPIAAIVSIYDDDLGVTVALCAECGRDLANVIDFMYVKDGGWSKLEALEARKRRAAR